MPYKILLIDDDPFIVDMYVLKFKEERFAIEVARDGKEGLKKAKEFGPDLILLDIVMPGTDGFQTLETLRKEGTRSKIILLTNLGQKEDVERGMRLGADDYVIKAHFTPSEVVAKARAVLEKP
ncbi:MAG: response regulator [Patescibacteria group bacterium]